MNRCSFLLAVAVSATLACSGLPQACAQSNDLCANAFVACAGYTYTGTTVGMTQDGTASCGYSNSTPDVWYKYTPASAGSATFSLCGSSYDTVISIHTGACPGSQIACNDDGCGIQSQVAATVAANTTYLIRISGYYGYTGDYSLTITGPACSTPCALMGDVNQDGVVNGTDIAGFVRAKLGAAPLPGENQACADYGTGTLDGDLALFVATLLQ